MVAHEIPYVAQSIPGRWRDLVGKAEKAFAIKGPAFINVLTPCPLGWICDSAQTVDIAMLAADTCIWPLYEVEYGEYKLTYKPKEKKPVDEYLSRQGRFRHLFKGEEGAKVRKEIQEYVDRKWERLLKKCGEA
jgi:pyruvate ferredoxin oxidoreductase beta subunit